MTNSLHVKLGPISAHAVHITELYRIKDNCVLKEISVTQEICEYVADGLKYKLQYLISNNKAAYIAAAAPVILYDFFQIYSSTFWSFCFTTI